MQISNLKQFGNYFHFPRGLVTSFRISFVFFCFVLFLFINISLNMILELNQCVITLTLCQMKHLQFVGQFKLFGKLPFKKGSWNQFRGSFPHVLKNVKILRTKRSAHSQRFIFISDKRLSYAMLPPTCGQFQWEGISKIWSV